jgi:hypothetical protein
LLTLQANSIQIPHLRLYDRLSQAFVGKVLQERESSFHVSGTEVVTSMIRLL